jgi:hypothetical protein
MPNSPTPEERDRMVADALKGSRLLQELEFSPEERLMAKLSDVNRTARNTYQVAVVKNPFHEARKDQADNVRKEVQHTYFQEFDKFEKHELQNLLSAFLASHLV